MRFQIYSLAGKPIVNHEGEPLQGNEINVMSAKGLINLMEKNNVVRALITTISEGSDHNVIELQDA